MKRSLYLLLSILLILGFAVHFTAYIANADDTTRVKGSKSNADNLQIQPNPEPLDAVNLNNSKSNTSKQQIQPAPKPAEGKSVRGSKSNTSE